MTERPVSCGISRLAGSEDAHRGNPVVCYFAKNRRKVEKKKKKRKERESSSSGACTDFRRRRGPPPSYVTPAACVTGWVTSVAPGGRRRTGAGKHTRNPPGTHWRCTDHFAFPHSAPPFNLPFTSASLHVQFTVRVCVTVRSRFLHGHRAGI